MRKAAIALALAVSLGGCANLQNAWQTFSSAQVTPRAGLITGNAALL